VYAPINYFDGFFLSARAFHWSGDFFAMMRISKNVEISQQYEMAMQWELF
jgi:hypothetical protein